MVDLKQGLTPKAVDMGKLLLLLAIALKETKVDLGDIEIPEMAAEEVESCHEVNTTTLGTSKTSLYAQELGYPSLAGFIFNGNDVGGANVTLYINGHNKGLPLVPQATFTYGFETKRVLRIKKLEAAGASGTSTVYGLMI